MNYADELELRRLLAHIDRIQARRFLAEPETPTHWPDFEESRTDPVALIHREVREQE